MITAEQALKKIASKYDNETHYFASPEDWQREIKSGISFEVHKYGHSQIDKHVPYKQGQLTVFVGHTNVGKTYTVLYLLSKMIDRKKLIVYSAENRISTIARYLIQFYWNIPSSENAKVVAKMDWLAERVEFINHEKRFTHVEILTQFVKGQHRGFDADIMFIDPYNALSVSGGHEGHYDAIEDFRIFTQQTGKSIFLNCHTMSESQRQKMDKSGATPVPMMSDVEGGVKFPNKADDVIVVHRNLYHMDEDERYVTLLYVGKIRNKEGGGEPTGFDSPIRMKFKKDWTGFTNDHDTIAKHYKTEDIF
jgi:replicative DNA helicase